MLNGAVKIMLTGIPVQAGKADNGLFQAFPIPQPVQRNQDIQCVMQKMRIDFRLQRLVFRYFLFHLKFIFVVNVRIYFFYHFIQVYRNRLNF